MAMITVTINGQSYQVDSGKTILEAAQENGINIPTLCHFEGLPARANCRMCIVEVEGMRTFQPACATKVRDGLVVSTNSEKVRKARKATLQMIMAHHAVDCHHCMRIGSSSEESLDPRFCEMCFWCDCERDGICELQALCREYHVDVLPYVQYEKDYEIDASLDSLIRNPNKCIKCRRCVDVCNDVQTVRNLSMEGRGRDIKVVAELGKPLAESACVRCGRCAQVCPTGALFMKEHKDAIVFNTHKWDVTTVTQLDGNVAEQLEELYKLDAGSISVKQVISALRKIGVDYVVTDEYAKGRAFEKVMRALRGSNYPAAVTTSFAVRNFVDRYYPELKDQILFCDSPQVIFSDTARTTFAREHGIDPAHLKTINVTMSNEDCAEAKEVSCVDYALNARELYRIFIRTGGAPHMKKDSEPDVMGQAAAVPLPKDVCFMDRSGAEVFELSINGKTKKVAYAKNLGQTREMLEALKAGKAQSDVLWLNA